MLERRVALVAIDSQWRDPKGTFYSFSYGIEKLRAAIKSAPDLADVEVLLLDLRSGDPEEYFERLTAFRPTLVGLSVYLWSLEIFAGLTERLRQWDPSIAIVAGGPSARRSVFDLLPHQALRDRLDAVVTGEGEAVIRELVREHRTPGWQRRVGGLALPSRGLWRSSATIERPDIELFPSPYQLDLAPIGMTGYIETFRGCPVHCAFCQWGEQKADRAHSTEYLVSHLEGLRRSRARNTFFLDAAFNLNPRAFRALVAAEEQVGVLKSMRVHGHLYPTYLKEEHLAFFDQLHQVQISVGIQSFDEQVLRRLGRPFDIDRFTEVLAMMRGRIDFDVELIFGLPGDNPASFRKTLERTLALGNSVKIFRCLVLPDALIERGQDLDIDFDPRTFALRSAEGWTSEDLEQEWAELQRFASEFPNAIVNHDWVGFVIKESTTGNGEGKGSAPLHADSVDTLRRRVDADVTGWSLRQVRGDIEELLFDLVGPDGDVVLVVRRQEEGKRAFTTRDGLAYSHRGQVAPASSRGLRGVIDAVHGEALQRVGAV